MSMTVSYEGTGRTNQKARTRDALIAATRELLSKGVTPTVEQAAARSGVSRATAYRYFPNQRALHAATYPTIEARSLLGPDAPNNAADRLDAVVDELIRFMLDQEPQLRTALRLSLEDAPAGQDAPLLRRGRAIGWIEDALAPLEDRLPKAELRRLVLAIRSAVGIEALVWLTGVAGLSRRQAADVRRFSSRALLRGATG
jgi:AcrR family transcriptional regulator